MARGRPHRTESPSHRSVWSAWLVGDPELLTAAYGNASTMNGGMVTQENSFEPATSGRQGGLVPLLSRFFWGRPSTSNQRRARLHVPLAADLATASADLLFSEPPQFTLDTGDAPKPKALPGVTIVKTPTEQRIDEYLNCGDFHAELVEAAELVAGLGGGWLRLVWDREDDQMPDAVMVESVDADAAIGEWRWGVLTAVTFFTEFKDKPSDQEVIRHLERHESGAVLHGLYRGSDKKLGETMNLADHPSTMPFVDLVNEEGAIPTGVKGLTAAYVANMRTQRRWRKIDQLRQLGRSDYDGVEPLMDALDETYTSWMRDLRLGKGRITVPEFMLQDFGKGKGAGWDEDQEVYTKLNMSPTSDKSQMTVSQFNIRVDEHKATAASIVDEIMRSAGYSPSTFGLDGDGQMATATEVVSRERQSARTRDKKMPLLVAGA